MIPLLAGAVGGATKSLVDALISGDDDSKTQGVAASVNGTPEQSQQVVQPQVSGSEAAKYGKQLFDAAFTKGVDSIVNPRMNGREAGKFQRDYLASAFPEMNPWERAGASAAQAGVQAGQQQNEKDMLYMQLNNQKQIAEINAKTQKEIAGIQSVTSRQNTKDQVYAQNEMLGQNIEESKARISKVMQDTSMSTTQQALTMSQMLTEQLKQLGIRATTQNTKMLTEKLKEEIPKIGSSKSELGKSVDDAWNVVNRTLQEVFGADLKDAVDWSKGRVDMFKKAAGILR